MRQFIVIISFVLLLSACVSTETTVTTKNTGAGGKMAFDPQAAAESRLKLALLYLKKDNMSKAKENIELALEYQPKNADIYRVFGYYYQQVNEYEKAEEMYKKSLSLDKSNPSTYSTYGTFLCKQERYQEADDAFLVALKKTSYTGAANTYENAGICSEKAGKIDKAIYYYQYALSHNPSKSNLRLTLAKLSITKKDYKTARLNLFNFQKKNKASAESLWQWIRLSYATGKNASLNKYAGKLLAEFPDSQQALDYLNHDYYE
jgi:type IV pilus assembly protein PilF